MYLAGYIFAVYLSLKWLSKQKILPESLLINLIKINRFNFVENIAVAG